MINPELETFKQSLNASTCLNSLTYIYTSHNGVEQQTYGVGHAVIKPSAAVKRPGITFDSHVSFDQDVDSTCSSALLFPHRHRRSRVIRFIISVADDNRRETRCAL